MSLLGWMHSCKSLTCAFRLVCVHQKAVWYVGVPELRWLGVGARSLSWRFLVKMEASEADASWVRLQLYPPFYSSAVSSVSSSRLLTAFSPPPPRWGVSAKRVKVSKTEPGWCNWTDINTRDVISSSKKSKSTHADNNIQLFLRAAKSLLIAALTGAHFSVPLLTFWEAWMVYWTFYDVILTE